MYQITRTPIILLIVAVLFGTSFPSWGTCIDPRYIVEGWDIKNDWNNREKAEQTCNNFCSPLKWDGKLERCAYYQSANSIICNCIKN